MPPPLSRGARIGVLALAGPAPTARLEAGLHRLEAEGFEVVEAPNARERTGYLAGDDEARLAGLEALLDGGVAALVASRGGYGTLRLLDRLPWERLAQWGGWVVGFSDLTALHAGMGVRTPVATLHGPMVTSLARDEGSTRRVLEWLRGEVPSPLFHLSARQVVRGGVARGVAVGGNLSLLCALVATPWEPEWDGAVLFLEDVGEPLYRLDRMLTHLRLASRLGRVAAVVVGRCTRCGGGAAGWRAQWRRLLADAVPPPAVIVEGLPFGHGTKNVPFPLGVEVEVDTGRGAIRCGGVRWPS